jgi:hypothetical protein
MKRLIAALILALGGVLMMLPGRASAIPTAAHMCHAMAPEANMISLYHEYDAITEAYVQAACWKQRCCGSSATATYKVLYWSDGDYNIHSLQWH